MKIIKQLTRMILFIPLFTNARVPEEGKTIFLSRCAACHTVNKVLTGPALSGIDQRRNLDWIINFVHSSQAMIKAGDSTAKTLFEKFNKVIMPDNLDLTADNIKNIIEYIKLESAVVTNTVPRPGKKQIIYRPVQLDDYGLIFGFLFSVIGLIAALYYSVQVKSFEQIKRIENLSK